MLMTRIGEESASQPLNCGRRVQVPRSRNAAYISECMLGSSLRLECVILCVERPVQRYG